MKAIRAQRLPALLAALLLSSAAAANAQEEDRRHPPAPSAPASAASPSNDSVSPAPPETAPPPGSPVQESATVAGGPNPALGSALSCGGACCGAFVLGLPAVGLALFTPMGVGGVSGLALVPLGAALGGAVGSGVNELFYEGDCSFTRVLLTAGSAAAFGLVGAGVFVGTGFVFGNLTEVVEVGAATAAGVLVPAAIVTGLVAGLTYLLLALRAAPAVESGTVVNAAPESAAFAARHPHDDAIMAF